VDAFVTFVTRLIYGSGAEAVITPNHRSWVAANPSPTGTQWLAHHVDAMLPAYESWLAAHNLPPIVPWNGTRPAPWDPSQDIPLPPALDGSFTGVTTLGQLGDALAARYTTVAGTAAEIFGLEKAPFSHRYWGFVRWAKEMRDRFNGLIVLPAPQLYDRDGTKLSAIPFLDAFNELHWRWHLDPPASGPTPGLTSSAGQRAGEGGVGMSPGEEFIKFHHDHNAILFEWLARAGEPAVRPINMGSGWPLPAQAASNPSAWTEPDDDPWINVEGGDTDLHLQAKATIADIGNTVTHGSGHGNNTDIGSLIHNNYSQRFFAWHGWIDNQWWWREPRFARWDATTGLRERLFRPELQTGGPWPGLAALTIVREPGSAADVVSPANAVGGLNLATGAGTLRMRFYVKDPYGRTLTLKLMAEVFDDATSTTVPVETIPESAHTYTVGPGGAFALETEFTVDFVFASAFESDDPTRANPAVGFVNSRIRISGSLEAAGDPGFVHRDFVDIDLVQEKQAPQVDVYLDLSSFSKAQVDAALAESGGVEARFPNAFIVAVQDRTSTPAPISWPAAVAPEVRGLLTRRVPAAGLFDAAAHAPEVEIWQETVDAPYTGLTVKLASGPDKEDPALPDNLPQRFTYRYDAVFTPGTDAFNGLVSGASRLARLRVPAVDRAGNATLVQEEIKLFLDANPYMRDGDVSWLSIDTRVLRLFEGDSRFGATLSPGAPNAFIQQVIQNLNTGSTDGDTFEGLPTDAVLEYSTAIPNPSTGTSTNVHNFALAKVRLQASAGAANVRALFRLFRYTATNLIFDPALGYRSYDDGTGKIVPLLGFDSAAAAAPVTSIPFFATARVPFGTALTAQTDTPNVAAFPAGPTAEQVMYFGAYLDINQPGSRLPATRIAAHPDGGFAAAEVQTLRTLMADAHQCMVVEVMYEPDPTEVGETPASSDNLAQRNLAILTSGNPGSPITRTVEHSFEVHTGSRRDDVRVEGPMLLEFGELRHEHHDGDGRAAGGLELEPERLALITAGERDELVHREAVSLAMQMHRSHNWEEELDLEHVLPQARAAVAQRFPLAFDAVDWQRTGDLYDELLFLWNGLPEESDVRLYLPRVRCEDVLNLRAVRHAPGDIKIVDPHTLSLVPRGVTYVPIPPAAGRRVAGVVTVALPEGIKRGERWRVDVVQVRGGERRTTGGFQLDIQVETAKELAEAERRLLQLVFDQLSLADPRDRWHPVLARRVETLRGRARAFAEEAGLPWEDPTASPDGRPFAGPRVRVVLERIEIVQDMEPWFKGRGEAVFRARVRTSPRDVEQVTRLPDQGVLKISDRPGENVLELDRVLFDGYAGDELAIEITGTEYDTFDPDDSLGRYARVLDCRHDGLFRSFGPNDEALDPEDVGPWRVHYRIERG
jgi:hypothetical protein